MYRISHISTSIAQSCMHVRAHYSKRGEQKPQGTKCNRSSSSRSRPQQQLQFKWRTNKNVRETIWIKKKNRGKLLGGENVDSCIANVLVCVIHFWHDRHTKYAFIFLLFRRRFFLRTKGKKSTSTLKMNFWASLFFLLHQTYIGMDSHMTIWWFASIMVLTMYCKLNRFSIYMPSVPCRTVQCVFHLSLPLSLYRSCKSS